MLLQKLLGFDSKTMKVKTELVAGITIARVFGNVHQREPEERRYALPYLQPPAVLRAIHLPGLLPGSRRRAAHH